MPCPYSFSGFASIFSYTSPPDDLTVLEDERHLARAHLEHGARTFAAGAGIAEPGIEEAGIVDAEFADQWIERHHFGRIVGRHLHRFLRCKDVELVRIEDQALVRPRLHRLPEVEDRITAAPFHIDEPGMALGAIAHEAARAQARQVDADRDALADIGLVGIDQALARMQITQSLRGQQSVAAAEADLRQARSLAHQDRKGARADFGIKRPMVAGSDAVETACLVGDHAREHVEPAGRALRIGCCRNFLRQRQAFLQRHDIDAARFEDRAVAQRNLVQLELVDPLGDGRAARQKTRAHAIGNLAEPKIEAGGLNLIGHELVFRQNRAVCGERRDHAVGQDALVLDTEGKRHGRPASKVAPI